MTHLVTSNICQPSEKLGRHWGVIGRHIGNTGNKRGKTGDRRGETGNTHHDQATLYTSRAHVALQRPTFNEDGFIEVRKRATKALYRRYRFGQHPLYSTTRPIFKLSNPHAENQKTAKQGTAGNDVRRTSQHKRGILSRSGQDRLVTWQKGPDEVILH